MNLPINSSQTGFPATSNASVGEAAGAGDLRQQSASSSALADQDWFSAQALSEGKTIEAGRFDSTTNRMTVEDAVNRVFSRIFSTPDDAPRT